MSHDYGRFRAAVSEALADEAEQCPLCDEEKLARTPLIEMDLSKIEMRILVVDSGQRLEDALRNLERAGIRTATTMTGFGRAFGHHRALAEAMVTRTTHVSADTPQVTHGPNHVADVRAEEKYRKAEAKRARREQIKRNGGKR